MSNRRTIWEHPIIAGVSVAAIVGLAIWIFPSVQAISKSVLAFVLGLLGTPIPLWVSLLGLGLFVAAVSIKRCLAGQAEADRISTTAELNKIAQEAFQPKGLDLDKILMESVEDEEHNDEEEENDWRSYTSDHILGIGWRWRWHGESIESLTALCPKCNMELNTLTSPEDPTGVMTSEQLLNGFACLDCDWGTNFSRDDRFETLPMLDEYVKKHIRRNAREKGLPI